MLEEVAKKVHRRDWKLLANKLDFTQRQIEDFEINHKNDAVSYLINWFRRLNSHFSVWLVITLMLYCP